MPITDFNNEDELERFRSYIQTIIDPIKKADERSPIFEGFLYKNQRTKAGQHLPSYYLVYFLLVDLLRYNNIVEAEKTAWAVKIEYKGMPFSIEYRKFGVGVFGYSNCEKEAEEITKSITEAVKAAEPFFQFIADK